MKLLLSLVVAGVAFASPTTITGYILGPDRQPAVCNVRVATPIDFTTPDGKIIKAGVVANKSTDSTGFLTIALESTVTSTPNNFAYNVTYSCGGTARWLVPASTTPIDISVVQVAVAPPLPPATIALTQLAASGATPGQVMCFDGQHWGPCNGSGGSGGGGIAKYGVDFSNTQAVVIPAAAHKLATSDIVVQVYDGSRHAIEADWTIDPSTYDVTVTFAVPQTGHVVLQSSSNRYAQAFTNSTLVTVLGSDHHLGTSDLTVEVRDASGKPVDADVSVDPANYNVTIAFAVAQSGRYVIQ